MKFLTKSHQKRLRQLDERMSRQALRNHGDWARYGRQHPGEQLTCDPGNPLWHDNWSRYYRRVLESSR